MSASGFVDDLTRAFFGDAFADHHQTRKRRVVAGSFGCVTVAIEQQEAIKLVFKLAFGAVHGAENQRMPVAKDHSSETLRRAAQQKRIAGGAVAYQPLSLTEMAGQNQSDSPA